MGPNEQPASFAKRGPVDRRRGDDFRSSEDKIRQGERRSGGDRRARRKQDSEGFGVLGRNLLYIVAVGAVFCFADVRFFDGQHSVRVAVEWGQYASSVAERWVGAGFAR
jgi:hypothetical protein